MTQGARKLCLVTGASAGIGAAFARLYAEKGYDLALTARRTERLEALAQELRARHGVEVLVLPGDLSLPEAPAELVAQIAAHGRVVDVLINNAGYGLRGRQEDHPWADYQAFLQVMVVAPTALAHALIPGMVERAFGRIVNVASIVGLIPAIPSQGLYSPAKAYLVSYSEGLHMELKGAGVHVTALCPGLTRSEFHQVAALTETIRKAPSWAWSTAEAVAREAYAAVEANRPICTPGVPNQILTGIVGALPKRLGMALTGSLGR